MMVVECQTCYMQQLLFNEIHSSPTKTDTSTQEVLIFKKDVFLSKMITMGTSSIKSLDLVLNTVIMFHNLW